MLVPFLIYWETGVRDDSLSAESLFRKAKAKGVVCDPDDRGGATLVGITIGTYREYCRRKCLPCGSVKDLEALGYDRWLDILKTMFWDRWQADLILDQAIANMLVDWLWTSGSHAITIPQRLLGVKADGIVGAGTLAALNVRNPCEFFRELKEERMAYVDRICRARPANEKFRAGWIRRINAIKI